MVGGDRPDRGSESDLARLLKSVGSDLRAQRKALGLTQTQVARRVRTSQARLSRIESGKATPQLQLLAALCPVLGLEMGLSVRQPEREGAEAWSSSAHRDKEAPIRR